MNHAGLAQAIARALRGPADARPDGRILWELSERSGLFRPSTVRQEIAGAVKGLGALILGDLGEFGVRITDGEASARSERPAVGSAH